MSVVYYECGLLWVWYTMSVDDYECGIIWVWTIMWYVEPPQRPDVNPLSSESQFYSIHWTEDIVIRFAKIIGTRRTKKSSIDGVKLLNIKW